jgi:hypothetical protein
MPGLSAGETFWKIYEGINYTNMGSSKKLDHPDKPGDDWEGRFESGNQEGGALGLATSHLLFPLPTYTLSSPSPLRPWRLCDKKSALTGRTGKCMGSVSVKC